MGSSNQNEMRKEHRLRDMPPWGPMQKKYVFLNKLWPGGTFRSNSRLCWNHPRQCQRQRLDGLASAARAVCSSQSFRAWPLGYDHPVLFAIERLSAHHSLARSSSVVV